MNAAGLTWNHYEGSLWPSPEGTTQNIAGATKWNQSSGGMFFDNPAESTIVGADGATYPSGVVAKKHNTGIWFADAVAQPDYPSNARSISGAYGSTDVNGNPIPYLYPSNTNATAADNYTAAGDWDSALQNYATANNITSWWTGNSQPWVQDQFKADLASGNVANLNIIVPDTKDDMHDIGTVPRTDYWAENVVKKIESSALWNDPTKRVAIVITFDEGESATPPAVAGTRSVRAMGRRSWSRSPRTALRSRVSPLSRRTQRPGRVLPVPVPLPSHPPPTAMATTVMG